MAALNTTLRIIAKTKSMKKIKLNTAKLQLNKERISSLTNDEMDMVNGGGLNDVMVVEAFGTRVLCFASKGKNCSDGSCGGTKVCGDKGSVVVVCLPM